MPKKQKRAESQHHRGGRHLDPLKEFAAKLESFLQNQERRERRNRLALAIAGPSLGLLGVLFSKQIASRISESDLAAGLTPEQLNRFFPWLSSVFIMASLLPWMNTANLPHKLHLPRPLGYGRVVRWYKRTRKFLAASANLIAKV
jgi:hypothetical protein